MNMNAATAINSVELVELDSESMPSKGVVGMICLIIAESAIFIIFVVAYLYYLGQRRQWADAESKSSNCRYLNSICLLSSSATITFARKFV